MKQTLIWNLLQSIMAPCSNAWPIFQVHIKIFLMFSLESAHNGYHSTFVVTKF